MILQQFVTKWLEKMADFDNAYQGQCVDLFRFYCKEVLNISQPRSVEGAADFWTNYSSDPNLLNNFTQIRNTPGFVPQAGDVMLWTRRAGGGFGHVAIVLEADINKFTSLDQNWPILSKVTKTVHDYSNVYGVLRPKTPITMTEKTYTEAEMTTMREQRDANWNKYEEERLKNETYQEKLADLARQLDLPGTDNIQDIKDAVIRLKDDSKEDKAFKEWVFETLKTDSIEASKVQINSFLTLEDALTKEQDKLKKEQDERQIDKEKYLGEIDRLEQNLNTISIRLEEMKLELQAKDEAIKVAGWFTETLSKLLAIIKKGRKK